MKLNEVFASSLLKAEDLNGKNVTVIIESLELKAFDDKKTGKAENKIILHFKGKQKGFVCNKTNAKTIAKLYGDETDAWVGKAITIGPREVEFQGEMTWAIRVSLQKPIAANPAPIQTVRGDTTEDGAAYAPDASNSEAPPF